MHVSSECLTFLFPDHITSPSSILMPVKRLAEVCHKHGAMVIVDGAHAPGQVHLNLKELGVDFYTGDVWYTLLQMLNICRWKQNADREPAVLQEHKWKKGKQFMHCVTLAKLTVVIFHLWIFGMSHILQRRRLTPQDTWPFKHWLSAKQRVPPSVCCFKRVRIWPKFILFCSVVSFSTTK